MIKTPFVELLKHIELLNEQEEAEMKKEHMECWLSFLSMSYAHPFIDSTERSKFIEIIKPDSISDQEIPHYETDLKLLEQLKSMQKGG